MLNAKEEIVRLITEGERLREAVRNLAKHDYECERGMSCRKCEALAGTEAN